MPHSTYETEIEYLISIRDGLKAIRKFVHEDPEQHYARMWNSCMAKVLAEYIERAYLRSQAVLAAMIASGKIASYPQLLEQCSAVLLMTALHFKTRSYHREHPRLKVKKPKDGGADSLPLFVQFDGFENIVAEGHDPAQLAELNDEKRRLPARARGLGRLPLQVYRRVKAYEFERGTLYGAFKHVARMAIIDGCGQVVKLRLASAAGPAEAAPAVIRQVRRCYQEASSAINAESDSAGACG
jgi:hypothetical protein